MPITPCQEKAALRIKFSASVQITDEPVEYPKTSSCSYVKSNGDHADENLFI